MQILICSQNKLFQVKKAYDLHTVMSAHHRSVMTQDLTWKVLF